MTRKKLLSIAIALCAAPAAHAVDFSPEDGISLKGTTFSIYGTVEPKVITETNENGDNSTELDDEDSTLGFAVESRLNDSVTGFAQIELEYQSDGDDGSGAFDAQDSAFMGVKGDFGKIQAGNFDSVYEDLIIDATEVAEDAEITDEAVAGEDNQIAYYSPDWNGFSFRTQVRIQGRDEGPDNEDSNEVGLSIAGGGYTGNNWGLYAGYDDDQRLKRQTRTAMVRLIFPVVKSTSAKTPTASPAFMALVRWSLAQSIPYRSTWTATPRATKRPSRPLRGTFMQGRTEFYGAVQRVSPDDETTVKERDEVTIGASHQLYSALSVWAEAGQYDPPRTPVTTIWLAPSTASEPLPRKEPPHPGEAVLFHRCHETVIFLQ